MTLAVGATGTAEVTPGAATAVKTLPQAPARGGVQRAVAGGGRPRGGPAPRDRPARQRASAAGRAHVTVIGHGFGAADRTGVAGEAEARVIASFDLMTGAPARDRGRRRGARLRDGANRGARTPVFVRAAQLRYGDACDPQLAIGRLRYAASSVGMLDGARARIRTGKLEVGAFGGLVPDPISGKPDTGASRFGAEVAYDDPGGRWQPRVAADRVRLDVERFARRAPAGRDRVGEPRLDVARRLGGGAGVRVGQSVGRARARAHRRRRDRGVAEPRASTSART